MRKSKSYPCSNSCFAESIHGLFVIIFLVHYWVFIVPANAEEVFDYSIESPEDTLISSNKVLNIDDFGAKGDGISDDTEILRLVWDKACSSPSGVKVLIPSNKSYLIRPTNFSGPCQSKVTLQKIPMRGMAWKCVNGYIFTGSTTLRCKEVDKSMPCTHAPTAITFHKCNYMKVRNITSLNSQQMHMSFTSCLKVKVSGLKVIAPADSPNTDGIHISESTRVELNDIFISTGDDCISIVGNSSIIKVKNIFCGAGHGISIGSLGKYRSFAGIHNIEVDGAIFVNTENGVRIKTWQGGSGFARKITFQNAQMFNVSNPIIIDQYYCDSLNPCFNQTSAVKISGVIFRGIKGTSAKEEAIVISCSDWHPCTNIYMEDINLEYMNGEEEAKSFCWKAYGRSSGIVRPNSCLLSLNILKLNTFSVRQWLYDYAFF